MIAFLLTIAFVAGAGDVNGATGRTTFTATRTASAGSMWIFQVGYFDGFTVSSVVANPGGTALTKKSVTYDCTGYGNDMEIWSLDDATGKTSAVITVSGSATFAWAILHEYANVATQGANVAGVGATSTVTTQTAVLASTQDPNNFLDAHFAFDNDTGTLTYNSGTGRVVCVSDPSSPACTQALQTDPNTLIVTMDKSAATAGSSITLQGTGTAAAGPICTQGIELRAAPQPDTTACTGGVVSACPHATGTTATTITSGSFSTANAVELLIATTAAQGVGTSATTVSASGGSFSTSFTKIGNCSNGSTTDVEVWGAVTSAALTTVTVSATFTATSVASSALTVVPFSASQTTLPSNFTCGTGTTGAATVSITTSALTSSVFGAGADTANTTARTPLTRNTIVNPQAGVTGTVWNQFQLPGAAGATTFGTSAPTSTLWDIIAVEVATANAVATLIPKVNRKVRGVGQISLVWPAALPTRREEES